VSALWHTYNAIKTLSASLCTVLPEALAMQSLQLTSLADNTLIKNPCGWKPAKALRAWQKVKRNRLRDYEAVLKTRVGTSGTGRPQKEKWGGDWGALQSEGVVGVTLKIIPRAYQLVRWVLPKRAACFAVDLSIAVLVSKDALCACKPACPALPPKRCPYAYLQPQALTP